MSMGDLYVLSSVIVRTRYIEVAYEEELEYISILNDFI